MLEYIEAIGWAVLVFILLYYFCRGVPQTGESAIIERLKSNGAQQVMQARATNQPSSSSSSSSSTLKPTSSVSTTTSTSSRSVSSTPAAVPVAQPAKVFFKTAKPNTNLNTAFLAKATPVLNVREEELAQLQEAHVVAKGREIVASVIGEPRTSRASFSEEGGRGSASRSSFTSDDKAKASELTAADLRPSSPEESQAKASELGEADLRPSSPEASAEADLRPSSPESEEILPAVRRGSSENDFVMLHSGPSPYASPTSVSADASNRGTNSPDRLIAVRVEYRDGAQDVLTSGTTSLAEFRRAVSTAFNKADLHLRVASSNALLDAAQDEHSVESIGLVSSPHVFATSE